MPKRDPWEGEEKPVWAQEVEPVVTVETGPVGGTKAAHPAFGQIGASHFSGGPGVFYGSDLRHNGGVSIKITTSTMRRSLSNDWPMEEKLIAEVELTYAQWVEFVANTNRGNGVPCTIRFDAAEGHRPQIAPPVPTVEIFRSESDATLKDALAALKKLSGTKLTGAQKDMVNKAMMEISANVGFVASQFDKHMEKAMAKAKIEIETYTTSLIYRTGLETLAEKRAEIAAAAPQVVLPKPEED